MTDDNNADGPAQTHSSDPTQSFGRQSDDEPRTGLIRRAPTGAIPIADAPATSIIRRTPTGAIPIADAPPTSVIEPATGLIRAEDAPATTFIPASAPAPAAAPAPESAPTPAPKPPPGPFAACATATACILSGWATAVIATSLIAGWWRTDPLFCVAIGFLAAVGCGATIGGQIAVLLRRRTGRVVVVVGALVTLVIFASLFVAGAQLPPIVYGIPVLPIASMVLAMLPVTGRWCTKT